MKNQISKYKYVELTLEDMTGDSGWHTKEQRDAATLSKVTMRCWIHSKDNKYVKTFASYIVEDNGTITTGDNNVIPADWITKIKYIKV